MHLRHKWILLLGDGEVPDDATRSVWRSALPRARQYRGPDGEEAFVYSTRYRNAYIRSTWIDCAILLLGDECAFNSDPMHIVTVNMTGERITETSTATHVAPWCARN